MKTFNPNKLYINKENILYNLKQIKEKANLDTEHEVEIMPVLKANAYGIGIENIISIIKDFNINNIGVATVEEAIVARQFFNGKILILSQAFKEQIPEIIKYDLIPLVSDLDFLKDLNRYIKNDNTVNVHLKIDTGMNRAGFRYDEILEIIDEIKSLSNLNIEGIGTHFSSSSNDMDYTYIQKEKFNNLVKILKEKFNTIKYIHSSNSGGIINLNQNESNLVRPGLMIYGYYPSTKDNLDLLPALEFKTQISHIHNVKKGEYIGYDKKVETVNDITTAILPFGYADGFTSVKDAYVLLNGIKVKVLTVNMDATIIDISAVDDVVIGSEVIVWNNKDITIDDWAKWMNSMNYELISNLSKRIEKIII